MAAIHVRTPVDLVTVLPYQLGFRPQDSLVLVGLRRRHLGVVQRLDLPSRAGEVDAAASTMVRHARRDGATAAVVIVYESSPGHGERAGAVLAGRLRAEGLAVPERMVVRAGRVYFPECPDRRLRVEGLTLPPDHAVPAVAEFVALGRRPSESRDRMAARVAAEPGPTSDRVARAAARLDVLGCAPAARRRAVEDWGRLLDPTGRPGDAPVSAAAAARMAVSLTDHLLRDLLCAWLCPGTLPIESFEPVLVEAARAWWPRPDAMPDPPDVAGSSGSPGDAGWAPADAAAGWAPETAGLLVDRLCWLARHCPAQFAPGVLAVLASYTWWLGDGPLTRVALERALSLAPDYRLAVLLGHLVDLAVRPRRAGEESDRSA